MEKAVIQQKHKQELTTKDTGQGWKFAVFYFISFSAVSLYGIYGNLYFKRRGISDIEIGILNAIPAWIGIFAPLIWGIISDALHQRKIPSFIMHIFAAGIFPLFWYLTGNFLALCVIMGIFTFFFSASIPLTDAWTLDHLSRRGGDYGKIRTWGSVGFAIPLLFSLFVLKRSSVSKAEDLLIVFYGFCAFRIISGFYALFLPDYSPQGRKPKMDWRSLHAYLHPFALTFFLATFMSRFLFGPYYTFFSIYLDEQGIADSFKGIFWVVAVGAEAGLIAISGSLLRRFGEIALLLAGLSAMAFRMFIYSLEPAWYIILATQSLHALTFGAFHVASIQIINRITPEPFRASGQTFNGALLGIGSLLGGVVGGLWAHQYGYAGLYRMLAIISAITTLLIGLLFLIWHEQKTEH